MNIPSATGAPLPDLDTFLSAAKGRAFDHQTAQAATQASQGRARSALWTLLPQLEARGAYTRNQIENVARIPDGQGGLDEATFLPLDQWDATITAKIPLVDVPKWTNLGASNQDVKATQAQAESILYNVKRTIVMQYYGYVAAWAVRASALDNVTVTSSRASWTNQRFSAGLVSELDKLRADAEVERARQSVAEADLAMARATQSLRTLTGLDAANHTPLPLRGDLTPEAPLEDWLTHVDRQPLVIAAQAKAASVEALAESTWQALLPTLYGTAQERLTNAAGFGQTAQWAVGLTVDWRFDPALVGQVESARADAQAASVEVSRAQRTLRDELEDAWYRVESSRAQAKAAQLQLTAARRARDIAAVSYEAGRTIQLDLLEAQRSAFLAEVQLIQALAELSVARADLRLGTGQSPTLEARP